MAIVSYCLFLNLDYRKALLLLLLLAINSARNCESIDDIDTEIIAMHYSIVWGERQRVFPQD